MCRFTFLVLRSLVYLGHIYEIFFPAKYNKNIRQGGTRFTSLLINGK
jgi:hypothetical protein